MSLNKKKEKKNLDCPKRAKEIIKIVKSKYSLRLLYEESYSYFLARLEECPKEGIALELGSGGGFLKEFSSKFTTSDVIRYENVDAIVDATNMPFSENELKMICMLNVLHHIPDPFAFFKEAQRCLKPGGKIVIIDQNKGIISTPILKYAHHEPFDETVKDWKFKSDGPLSSANGALPWIIFKRDIEKFKNEFSELEFRSMTPHTPLRYWLTGGLKNWNLLPKSCYKFATLVDRFLLIVSPRFGSFVSIEIQKKSHSKRGDTG